MKASYKALDLIKQYEGCELEAYLDANGKWAVGYGQTSPNITRGLRILQSEADQWLLNHTGQVSQELDRLVSAPLTQQQHDALVSLVYNIGVTAFSHSTLLRFLNNQQFNEAGMEILKWTHSQGQEVPGLVNRRSAEYRLFNS